jgi:short-subunit dehydrogenase involved in D-alanine esterification of teichoic acids
MSPSSDISTILILGATSGLGEAFARHFHSKGKHVIATGRRLERLSTLKSQLPGLETARIDVEDLTNLESNLTSILQRYPLIDSVLVMSGKMEFTNFKDPSSMSAKSIISEVNTNLIAPLIVSRIMVPHLLSLGKPATYITVSSGLAYIPLPNFPVYNATKAGIHNFTVTLRTQLAGSNVNVVELAPPYVDTALDASHRDKAEGGHPPMPLGEYMETAVRGLESEGVKEVATGFSEMGVETWRAAFGPILEKFGLQG